MPDIVAIIRLQVTAEFTKSMIICYNWLWRPQLAVSQVDLNRPMKDVLAELSKFPIKTRLSLSGTLVVARDIAHAKLKERLDSGQGLPEYVQKHPIYYAGPAKTPKV